MNLDLQALCPYTVSKPPIDQSTNELNRWESGFGGPSYTVGGIGRLYQWVSRYESHPTQS